MIEYKAAIRPHKTDVYADPWDAAAAVAGIPQTASVTQLRSLYAWVDPNADPEMKAAYRFPHHSVVDGPANIRACVVGIAAINGGRGGTKIPDPDRMGVHEHLASHLRDAEREPAELKSQPGGGPQTLGDHVTDALLTVYHALEIADRARSQKSQVGKALTVVNVELLEWLGGELGRLRSLVDSPDDIALREFARYIAAQHGRTTA